MCSERILRVLTRVVVGAVALLVVVACGTTQEQGSGAPTEGEAAGTNGDGDAAPTPEDDETSDGESQDDEVVDLSQDPSRLDALIEAAREEGQVVWYTPNASATADEVAALFEEEYDIPVVVHRAGGGEILQRFLLEADSNRVQGDLVSLGSDVASTTSLVDDGYFECNFVPREFDNLHEWAQGPPGCWGGERGVLSIIAYRTDLLEEAGIDPPQSWEDLTKEEFRGRVHTPHPAYSSTTRMTTALLSDAMGWDWYERLRDNDAIIVRDQAALLDALETGEALVVGPANHSRLAQAKVEGRPIEVVAPEEGTFLGPSPNLVPVGAPHPNAGMLLADFVLTEPAQQVYLDAGNIAGRADFSSPEGMPPMDEVNVLPVDWDWMIEAGEEPTNMFADIFEVERSAD